MARGAFVTRQSKNLVLRGLQDRGLVQRPESVDQGRARPSQLTGTGREVLEIHGLAGDKRSTRQVGIGQAWLLAQKLCARLG